MTVDGKPAMVARDGHVHCELECDHPQAMTLSDGRKLCGCCWFERGVETPMVLCTPDACPDEPAEAFVAAPTREEP